MIEPERGSGRTSLQLVTLLLAASVTFTEQMWLPDYFRGANLVRGDMVALKGIEPLFKP